MGCLKVYGLATTHLTHEVVEGWSYPVIDRIERFDLGFSFGMTVKMGDGSIRALRIKTADLMEAIEEDEEFDLKAHNEAVRRFCAEVGVAPRTMDHRAIGDKLVKRYLGAEADSPNA